MDERYASTRLSLPLPHSKQIKKKERASAGNNFPMEIYFYIKEREREKNAYHSYIEFHIRTLALAEDSF